MSVLCLLAYQYSKGALEEFFKNERLFKLFHHLFEEIKAMGYTENTKRSHPKINQTNLDKDCQECGNINQGKSVKYEQEIELLRVISVVIHYNLPIPKAKK